jgi:capsular exopolysaccharide synthesis family protein
MSAETNKNGFSAPGSNFLNSDGYHFNGQHSHGAEDYNYDIKYLFYLLWNHKWIISGVIVLCMLTAAFAAMLKTPIYQSDGSLMITESGSQYSYAGSDLGNLLTNSYGIGVGSSITDELQILRSRNLSLVIADTLMEQPLMENGRMFPVLFESYPEDSTIAHKKTIAYRLRQNLSFAQIDRESNLINISYMGPSPIEAAHIVDLAIQSYSHLSTRQNRKSANAAVKFLETERERIENQLNKTELQLQQYMDENELVQVDAQTESLINRLADLEQRRQEARTRVVAINSAIEQYQGQVERIRPGLADQYADAIGPNMQRLQYQLAELKTERVQMLSENPQLKSSSNPPPQLVTLNRKIKDYEDEIRSLTDKLLGKSDEYIGFLGNQEGGNVAQNISDLNKKLIELKIDQQRYQAQEEVLSSEISKLNRVFDDLPENMIGLARLKRSVAINEELYLTISKQYAEMSLWQQTQFGQGQLVDEGYLPALPIEPSMKRYLFFGFMIGTILGVGFVFIKESFNTTIDGTQKLKQFEVPMLAVIPDLQPYIDNEHEGKETKKVQEHRVSTHLVSLFDTISPATESFRRLESNILHSNPDTSLNSMLITSTTKGEGKTTVAANLAVVMAEADQRVIVVDVDLRRPNLHKLFGLDRSPGIVDVLFENSSLEDVIKSTVIPNLSVLCAGKRPPNPSAITKSASFLKLIKQLEKQYDRVILDTPPFGIITDSSSLVSQTGGVVVISRFGKTKIGELDHTLKALERIDATVTGTVLNGFDSGKNSDYYYGNSYYKDFYGDYEAYENAG